MRVGVAVWAWELMVWVNSDFSAGQVKTVSHYCMSPLEATNPIRNWSVDC